MTSSVARQRERARQLRLMVALERATQSSVKKIITSQVRTLAAAFSSNGKVSKSDLIESRKKLEKALTASLTRTVTVFSKDARDGLKADPFKDTAHKWIRRRALEKAASITEETVSVVRNVIRRSVDDGIGAEVIASRIRQAAPDISLSRSLLIARTEVHTASQFAQIEQAKTLAEDTGIKLVKVWTSAQSARTREDHAAADGQTVGLDEQFTVGGERLDGPGLGSLPENNINCRCVVLIESK